MLCPFISGVVFSLFTCRWYILHSEWNIIRLNVLWGAAMTKRFGGKKLHYMYMHSFQKKQTFKMVFCANVAVYECNARTIYCRPFTTPKKKLCFPSLIGVKFGVCLDKSLRGFCNFNKLWLVILHYIAIFIENLVC